MKVLGHYFIEDGSYFPVDEWKPVPQVNGGFTLYEVLRVIRETPVFMDEHLQRLRKTVKVSSSAESPGFRQLKNEIISLVKTNKLPMANLRIELYYTKEGMLRSYRLFMAERPYPSALMYRQGVDAVTMYARRPNPSAKVLRWDMKQHAEKLVKEKQVHDVIYLNEQSRITEGSRTNIFFVQGRGVVTAPARTVLRGITRDKVIDLCSRKGIEIEYRAVSMDELYNFDAAFFTGTSPKVLPVKSIDGMGLNPDNSLIRDIMKGYDAMIDTNINETRKRYF